MILDVKDEKVDLNKVVENKFQHLIETQRNKFLKLFQYFEELFDGTLSTWKIGPVDLE